MKQISFNVSANTARLIGRENIANLEGAIIELVKNTYDADASTCIIYYEASTKSLWIIDNGSGMNQDTIVSYWMTIGNSSKVKSSKTQSGRIQTGEKGIGRFTLDRIAQNCTMHTISDDSNFSWSISWSDFDDKELISDVYATLEDTDNTLVESCDKITNNALQELLWDRFSPTGTCFHLTNLRDEWNETTVSRLKSALSRLLPPDINKN